jgi:hypothetical protein
MGDLKALRNRRFLITKKGYPALDLQTEDRIALLLNADVPFTLGRCRDSGTSSSSLARLTSRASCVKKSCGRWSWKEMVIE